MPKKKNDAPEAPQEAPEPIVEEDVVAALSEKLSQPPKSEQRAEDAPTPVTPQPFDISQLSPDQLQSLKAMLEATPERSLEKAKNPVVRLRKVREKIVVDFKNAFTALVYNAERRGEVETPMIPVLLDGDKEYTDVPYAEFMQAEQVRAEIISTRTKNDPRVEGEVVSKETGKLVEMVANVVVYHFTVKLPDGRTLEIEGKLANA